MPRVIENIFIAGSLAPLATFVLLLLAWHAVLWNPGVRARATSSLRMFGPLAACAAAGIALIAFAGFGAWYSRHPGFASEVEPLVTTISGIFHHGGPLYHAPDAAERYSVLYGPSVYLATGLSFLMFGLSITAAKTGALLALLGSLVFLHLALRRHMIDATAFVLTAAAAMLLWICGTSAFVVRPDAYLLFGVSVGLWSAGLHRRSTAVIGTALAFGFVVNLKIHAGLYMLPVLAMLDARHGWRSTLAALGLGTAAAMAPFAFHPGISPNRYLEWVFMSTHHGLQMNELPILLRRGLLYAIPVLVPLAAGARFPDSSSLRRNLGLAWLVGNVAVIILALKPGAGLVHLLPLVPINLVSGAMLWIDRRHTAPNLKAFSPDWRLGFTAAFLLTVLLSGSVNGYRSGRQAAALMADAGAVDADIGNILAGHPNRTIGMGYGGEGLHFRHTYQRPLLAFAEQPVLIDAVAQMDAHLSHLEISASTLATFDTGLIEIWLIPRDQTPFAKCNWYSPHEEIFSPEVREHFRSHYSLEETFDLWTWRGAPVAGHSATGTHLAP